MSTKAPEDPAEHKARHIELHRMLDELLADFLAHNPDKLPSTTPIMALLRWAHEQTLNPTPSGNR